MMIGISMGCVHSHWRMFAIEGWGSPSHIRSVLEKNGQEIRKAGNIGQVVS
jgi:hypothetical protein